ncbi:hypothetical protein LX32DRAFT_32372 [Colletotrichum zoysiae]|uniref:Secreted protein n=1 Tax=Colletotrichum zoysiae TaxID=1216348 RepID=A0AAD9M1T6_9PEZI|nr:hypothetical protein LX32DRAFT_32372 [Colletotrichum zoysiae]
MPGVCVCVCVCVCLCVYVRGWEGEVLWERRPAEVCEQATNCAPNIRLVLYKPLCEGKLVIVLTENTNKS